MGEQWCEDRVPPFQELSSWKSLWKDLSRWERGKTRLLSVKSQKKGTQLLSAEALKRPAQREGERVLREPEKWWHLVHLLCISEWCWEMPRDKEKGTPLTHSQQPS